MWPFPLSTFETVAVSVVFICCVATLRILRG